MKTELTMQESLEQEKGRVFPRDFLEETLQAVAHSKNCIAALQKEIPLKLEYAKKSYEDAFFTIIDCKCPTCGFTWSTFCEKQKRCPDCGQLLEW